MDCGEHLLACRAYINLRLERRRQGKLFLNFGRCARARTAARRWPHEVNSDVRLRRKQPDFHFESQNRIAYGYGNGGGLRNSLTRRKWIDRCRCNVNATRDAKDAYFPPQTVGHTQKMQYFNKNYFCPRCLSSVLFFHRKTSKVVLYGGETLGILASTQPHVKVQLYSLKVLLNA